MSELAYETIEPDVTEQAGWTILDDKGAEWAINKIREAEQDTAYWEKFYKRQMDAIRAQNEGTAAFMRSKLEAYFGTVPTHNTKTQRKYTLPSADLVVKLKEPKWEHDDEKLLPWLESNEYKDAIKVKKEVAWSKAKEHLVVDGTGAVCDKETGEVCEAVKAVPQEPEFKVVLKDYIPQ